jgi:hypothetical protein
MPFDPSAGPTAKSLYSPGRKQVACALLAAAFGCDRRVHGIISSERWFTAPTDDMIWVELPIEHWRQLAAMPQEQWPGPESFRLDK